MLIELCADDESLESENVADGDRAVAVKVGFFGIIDLSA